MKKDYLVPSILAIPVFILIFLGTSDAPGNTNLWVALIGSGLVFFTATAAEA